MWRYNSELCRRLQYIGPAKARTGFFASEAERRQLSERLTGLLAHRQAGSVPTVALRPPWWKRWFRG